MTSLSPLERLFLTDSGLETDMIFNHGIDLPHFAAITMLQSPEGRAALDVYFRQHIDVARRAGTGFVLQSASWRASPDWAAPLGLSVAELDALNIESIAMLHRLRDELADTTLPMAVSGCLGPRGDGYDPGRIMSPQEAEAYHGHQAALLAAQGPDLLSAMTITNVPEAIGITHATAATGVPLVLSFTVETDGRLPTGDTLADAIAAVDTATGSYPAYYMVNCAHPSHFAAVLDGEWAMRVRGVRANASRCSHAELDAMTELDAGDPAELGQLYAALRRRHPQISVLGGCCGTDLRHIEAIAAACTA